MDVSKINSEVTHGNYGLERVLREIVGSFQPSFIPGNIYVVFNTSDEAYAEYAKNWNKKYSDGTPVIHTSISSAYDSVTSNRNDVILVNAHNAHAQTAILSVTKNRMHVWGMGMRTGFGIGARARITMGVTTAAADIAVMKNTGVGNTFRNLKFDSSNTKDESLYSVAEGGEYSIYEGCEIYKSTDLNETGAAEVLNNGDSAQWLDCVFGSTVNEVADDKIRPNMLLTR